MPQAIDHIVIAVPDLDAAVDDAQRALGLAFTSGGEHPGAGTANRIAFLGEAYLELIGVTDREAAAQRPIGAAALRALEAGGGLATYALREDHLETTVAELRANASPIGPVEHGSRRRPDGETVNWWTATLERLGPDRPPFLIRHAYAGAEWGAEALAERRAFRHPLGSPVSLVRLDIATPDPPALAADYHAALGLEFWAVADLAVCTVGPHTIRLRPTAEMQFPAAVLLGAQLPEPRSVELLGLRFGFEPVTAEAVGAAGASEAG
ncbi:MAG TPA: VOC family protein [candidate division Zixibacteria bacterium]|nr:VOC family protein [candidate division Zixibacteria bacterium]